MIVNDIQQLFFQQIKSQLPSNISFVDEVADRLGLSNDSAYRRIRGEKELSLTEFMNLCAHYKISADQFLSNNESTTLFTSLWIDHSGFNFEKYLADMLHQLTVVASGKEKKMYYEAKDIPLFYYFQFSKLAAFKYFFWMRTILGYEEYSRTHYEDNQLATVLDKTGHRIIETYTSIPTIEIWNIETINVTLRQLKFYRESNVFRKKESVLELYEELELMINHIQYQAEKGRKFLYGNTHYDGATLELYSNEVFLGHNTIMAEVDGNSTVFINHGVLNYMITHNSNFCQRTKMSLENTIRKSTLISVVGEKERQKFFYALKHEISQHKLDLLTHTF